MKKQFYSFGMQAIIYCLLLVSFTSCKQNSDTTEQAASNSASATTPVPNETRIVKKSSGTYQKYKATHRPYSILLPNGWKIKEHYKSGTLRVTSPLPAKGEDPFEQYVLMTPMPASVKLNPTTKKMEPLPINLEDFLQRHLRTLKSKYPDAAMIDDKRVTIAGKEAAQITYEHQSMEEPHVNITTISNIFVHEHQTYILSFIEAADNFENCRPMYQEIFKSFRFNKN